MNQNPDWDGTYTPANALVLSASQRGLALGQSLGLPAMLLAEKPNLGEAWETKRALIFVCAIPIAVRLLSTLPQSKSSDPAVVCVDDSYHHAVALLGGHHGANRLAMLVSAATGATAVVTTSSDTSRLPALDLLPGFRAKGDLAKVQAHLNGGGRIELVSEVDWPLPILLPSGASPHKVLLTDRIVDIPTQKDPTVTLTPPSLVLGLGCSSDCAPEELAELVSKTLRDADLDPDAIERAATVDSRCRHPAITALPYLLRSFSAKDLANIEVPNPSTVVESAIGTPSVSEAAALLAAGPGGVLIVAKQKSERATVAVARRKGPAGKLHVVGLGPGAVAHRTRRAEATIIKAEVVVGFDAYVAQCADLLTSSQVVLSYPIGEEITRVDRAIKETLLGRIVTLVCSGDPGIYAMATLVFQRVEELNCSGLDIEIVPGVTAALAGSALAGAVLGHDHAYLSLSDLLTPWETIRHRLVALASTDMAIVLYNPRSRRRTTQLQEAIQIFSDQRGSQTKVVVASRIARKGEAVTITTLSKFDPSIVDMETLVFIGSSSTRDIDGRLYTPRGYES